MDPAQDINPADDRYASQRVAGFPWLRFEPALEAEYRENYIAVNSWRIRASAMISVLSVFGFITLDQFFGLNIQDLRSDLILMSGTIPAFLLPVAVTYRDHAGAWLLSFVFLGAVLVSMSVVAVIYLGRASQPWFPWESLMLVMSYTYFVSGLMFYQAVWCGALVWVGFVVTNWNVQLHERLLYEAYYLAVCNGLGMLGLYMLQHQSRLSWLMQNELRRQAVLDPLTHLMNRRAFSQHLETAWLQAQRALAPVGLMLIDIDGFKKVNDSCGHQFGDTALKRVADVLRASVLRPLDAAARYGGDEFIAVWYDVDGGWLQRLAAELPAKLEGLSCGDREELINITVSGGAVIAWPRPGMSMRDAIREADSKLYDMKRNDPGKVGFVVLKNPEKASAAA